MPELSIIIPARNEMFLSNTIDNIIENIEGDTEIIAILDGAWADPPIKDHHRVTLIHYPVAIGQRAATNVGVRFSRAKYIMKCDAHCAFDKGFDVKLMADCEKDWIVIPRMYNLHVFDWKCKKCGHQTYQGPYPKECIQKCGNTTDFERVIIYKPRLNRRTDFARFDNTLHFQYWSAYEQRPEVIAQGDIADTMCFVGACCFMQRDRYWEIDGLDEAHGSWGQMGVEFACKSWLSGGRLVVNKKTWFSHLFRTQPGFGFPYPNPGIEKAREHSRRLWIEGKWPKAVHKLDWLIQKFAPVPDWPDIPPAKASSTITPSVNVTKSMVYYTDNRLDSTIFKAVQRQLIRCCNGYEIVSVSLRPTDFGRNITLNLERGYLTMFKQIYTGISASKSDIIFLCEHDILYSPTHFDFIPPRKDTFYYNRNQWKVDAATGRALFYLCDQTSGLCAYRDALLDHYEKRIAIIEKDGYNRNMGFEPGTNRWARSLDGRGSAVWMSTDPNIDIRHSGNLTRTRWSQDQFRDKSTCTGWKMADEVPGWGKTKDRFNDFLLEIF